MDLVSMNSSNRKDFLASKEGMLWTTMMRIYTIKQRVRCLSTPRRFFPWISSSKTVYQISLRVVIPKERTNTCWSALFSCGCMTRLSPCRSWCWQWQLQWSWLGCRTRLSVRNHPVFLWPKNHGKRYGSKLIQNHMSFPGFQKLMEKYGSWLIFLVFTVFYIRELLETIMVTLRPTATDGFLYFGEVARCTKSWRCQRTSSPWTRAMASGSVQFLPFSTLILIFRIMIFSRNFIQENACSNLDLTWFNQHKDGWFFTGYPTKSKNSHVDLEKPSERPSGALPVAGNDPLPSGKLYNIAIENGHL